jgi:hypothetical protein
MASYEREYRWYLIGCNRLGQQPVSQTEFSAEWLEYETIAERLKQADAQGTLALESDARRHVKERGKDNPFIKAILVGMAEEQAVR